MDLLFLLPRLQVQPRMAGDLDLRENDRNGCATACQDHEQPMCGQAWDYLWILVADGERRVMNVKSSFRIRFHDLLTLVSMVALHFAPSMPMVGIFSHKGESNQTRLHCQD